MSGVPWTFYYVFIAVKTSLITLALFLFGVPLIFKRKLGDGRFFIFFWAFMWFLPFTFLGGKFTRYFTLVEPLILIAAAVGFCFSLEWLSEKLSKYRSLTRVGQFALLIVFAAIPLMNSLAVAPHLRMFTNVIGGGMSAAGTYFPHDEFYDASTRDIVENLSKTAKPGAIIACETPALFEYYAVKSGRKDLVYISLSDRSEVMNLKSGDFVVLAEGRRYFSNSAYIEYLERSVTPVFEVKMLDATAARVFELSDDSLAAIRAIASK